MSDCRQCKVKIMDATNICPLCHCAVGKDGSEKQHYPDIRIKQKKIQLALRIYLAAAIVIEAVLVYLNRKFMPDIWWSLLSLAAFIAIYASVSITVSNRTGYRSRTIGLTVFATTYIVLVDAVLGFSGWSVNYVLPSSILFLDVAVVVAIFVNMRNWQSYLILEILLIFCNLLPFTLVFLGITTKPFLTYLAFWITAGLFICTCIIGGKKSKAELQRRFHV